MSGGPREVEPGGRVGAEFGRTRWRRSRDVRGRDVPESVVGVVAHVQRRVVQARWAEALGLGIAAGFVTAAAGVLSDVPRSPALAVLAGGAGVLTALTWVLGSRRSVARLVRRLDERLRFGGALLTAWEGERVGRGGPVDRLLDERVRERLRPEEARGVAVPGLGLPVVALLASLAGWLVALEFEEAPPAPVDVAALVEGARVRLSVARRGALEALEDGALDPERARALVDALERCERLESTATEEELEDLDRELARRVREVGERSELATALEGARAQLDAARGALERRRDGASGGADAAGGDPADDAASGELTNGGRDGMMAGSAGPDEGAPDGPVGSGPGSEGAAPDAPEFAAWSAWWPAEYDALVRAWVERRRP